MRLSELPDIHCLGVKALGLCSYDLSNPSLTFFSIGQLATVVALIFAFSQLAKPIVKFRLATRFSPQWVPWLGIALAILCVFWAAILRGWPLREFPVIGYPIVWEFVAGVSLVWASAWMIFRVSTTTRLSARNAARYLRGSRLIIARGNMDDLREYGDEIATSISTVVVACKNHQMHPKRLSAKLDEKEPPTDFEMVCYTLLDLWADKQFCEVLVTRCPQTGIEILLQVQNERLYESGAYALVQELIDCAMSHPDSILHREGDYSGLGRFKPFMTTAFGSADFVNSSLRPLQAWRTHEQDRITTLQVSRYGDAMDIALRAAIDERRIGSIYAAYSSALNVVNGIALQAAWAMARIPESEVSQSEWSRVLHQCGEIHCKGIATIASLPAELQPSAQEAQIDPATYNRVGDRSIYDAIARNAYEYVERLAMCKGHDDHIRSDAINLWDGIFPHQAHEIPHAANAIRQRFLFELRKKVSENLDVEHWYYPVVTRVLLAMWGIPDCPANVQPLPDSYSRDESDLYVFVYTLIRQNFVAIRQRSLEYANDLLPERVDYVHEPPSLRQAWFRDKTTSLSLVVPANSTPQIAAAEVRLPPTSE